MEGRPDPSAKNYLAKHWSLGDRMAAEETMTSLIEHPGWALIDEVVDAVRLGGFDRLASGAIPDHVEIANKLGVQNGMTYHRDVVASVLDSAKTARAELKKTAALDEAAERS
jgi:hypothetical protein